VSALLRPGLSLLASVVLAGAAALAAEPPRAAQTPPDIRWPTPSQPPGTVSHYSKHSTEAAWDPALRRFAQERGNGFQAMAEEARRYAAGPGEAPTADLSPTPGAGVAAPSPAVLLRAVDIVRLPVLPSEEMAAHTARLHSQLEALRPGGFGRAVWEVTDLPADDQLPAWTNACLAAFPQPPILMLGWHLDGGRVAPAHDPAAQFLQLCVPRCHSVMITGEELNSQFYAAADGGLALPFLRYWIGVLRSRSPKAFVWCRIDEMVASQRPNSRQGAWARELLPLCDGLAYQANHGARDVDSGHRVSEQFQAVEGVVADLGRTAVHPPRRDRGSPWPVALGGFSVVRAAHPSLPAFGMARLATDLRAYESWLAAQHFVGYIRYVGVLPAAPVADLLACAVPGAAAPARTEGAPPEALPGRAAETGGTPTAPPASKAGAPLP